MVIWQYNEPYQLVFYRAWPCSLAIKRAYIMQGDIKFAVGHIQPLKEYPYIGKVEQVYKALLKPVFLWSGTSFNNASSLLYLLLVT